jgi:hypothetical protein
MQKGIIHVVNQLPWPSQPTGSEDVVPLVLLGIEHSGQLFKTVAV